MKVSVVTGPRETQVIDAPKPLVGPADVLVKIRACGICGTDALFISMGGMPGHDDGMPSPCPSGGRCPSQPKPSDKVVVFGAGPIGLGARLGVVAVRDQPVPVDFVDIMSNEITIVGSMGYPDEIFEVTKDLIDNWEKCAVIVSHTIPFDDVVESLKTASTHGAADKVVVTFN